MCFVHLQDTERIPYKSLLKLRRSSSSVPAAQPRGGPSQWSPKESHSNPSAWRDTLNSRSLQNSPHKPALPYARAAHAEEEDWPDLTQLRWEGGATGVVRGQQYSPVDFRELRQNSAKISYPAQDPHGLVLKKMRNSRPADQHQTLPHSVSLAKPPRSKSPKALPLTPQGRAVARSSFRARQQQQQLGSHGSPRPKMNQPLRTHISLESLVIGPKPAGADHTEALHTPDEASLAQALVQDEPDHQQLSQHDFVAAAWRQHDNVSQLQSRHHGSSVRSSHMTSRGADRGGIRGVSCQQASPQQPALHETRLDSIKKGDEEEARAAAAAARAIPSFASPTRSSEAKAQHAQRSLHTLPFRRSTSRHSAGSHVEDDAHKLLRKHSEGSHQAVPQGGVSFDEVQNPGSGRETPSGGQHSPDNGGQTPSGGQHPPGSGGQTPSGGQHPPGNAAPLTSTFRLLFYSLCSAVNAAIHCLVLQLDPGQSCRDPGSPLLGDQRQ